MVYLEVVERMIRKAVVVALTAASSFVAMSISKQKA